jgi:Na+-transporting methylmalonyl-CoA/oxaloacetate decarboxylase gamma subunit
MKDKKKTTTKVIVTAVTVVGGLGVIFVILFILAFMVYGA